MKPDLSLTKPARSGPPIGAPWWRFGMVWLVISGPAVVVVASSLQFGDLLVQCP